MDSSRTPEQAARADIDALLGAAGWVVQDYRAFNPTAGRGIALREVPLKTAPCDYLLLVERKAVGVIEAKRAGTPLSGVADQSANYAENLPDFLAALTPGQLPFLYESTGVETFFRDERDPDPRSRRVFRSIVRKRWPTGSPRPRRFAALPAVHPRQVQRAHEAFGERLVLLLDALNHQLVA